MGARRFVIFRYASPTGELSTFTKSGRLQADPASAVGGAYIRGESDADRRNSGLSERGGKAGFTVEFVGTNGEVVSVSCPQNADGSLNRLNAVAQAKEILAAAIEADETLLAITGTKTVSFGPRGSACECPAGA